MGIAKKAICIMFIPLLVEVLVACCRCGDSETYYYSFGALSVAHLNNAGEVPQEVSEGEINKAAYGIRALITTNRFASSGSGSLMFSSAWAFDCECLPEFTATPEHAIRSIKIVTVNDFDAETSAGADITPYFRIHRIYHHPEYVEYLTADEFTQLMNWYAADDLTDSSSFFNTQKNIQFDLFLMTPPESAGIHQFLLEIELENGEILSAQTDAVNLV